MNRDRMQVIAGGLSGSASLDTAISRAILQRVSKGELPETLQVGRPHRVVAFGKHDTLTPGFEDAVTIATDHGFDPTVRIAGGRAVVFHPQIVRFAWTVPAIDPVFDMQNRFTTVADHTIAALGSFGVPTTMGELNGEYCPGTYSIHIEGGGKVMGSGQRLTRRAAQVGGMIVVNAPALVNDVLLPVYDAMGLHMDPARTGAVSDRIEIGTDAVLAAFAREFTRGRAIAIGHVDDATMKLARPLQPKHDPRLLA